jgi:hypothetical protein
LENRMDSCRHVSQTKRARRTRSRTAGRNGHWKTFVINWEVWIGGRPRLKISEFERKWGDLEKWK